MAMIAVWLKIDEERAAAALEEAVDKLDSADGEVILDFSSVRRIDPATVSAMEKLAGAADAKGVKLVLRGVNVEVYKVLKLVRLAPRFCFLN